ncbi:molybdate ABC transporter substrate-binding protein [Vibrio sp. SA48]|uniref:molybdate ABC transporter substrate-binding protein n=1 Tax=Vibrio sp. S12_S33 TaxID=2720223 RepID=UPI001781CB11|nr:molybdate ABC transporter substrate-binding protein [Vibrio sp. S12_S33]MBD1566172.1 molybdate ABC transporter substrate-binding protein [Vibrio sp. S12_S33]
MKKNISLHQYTMGQIQTIILSFVLLCGSFNAEAKEAIYIYAGAGMKDAIDELIVVYQQHNDVIIKPVYASSSTNARQIELGAPADIYISANWKWMNYLINKKIINQNDAKTIAKNDLVLIAPSNSNLGYFDVSNMVAWEQHLNGGKLAIGEPNSVPVGIYAKQSLTSFNVWHELKHKTVQTKTVRAALLLVERGEAALGIVFNTDTYNNSLVDVLTTFPSETHKPIEFTMAQVSNNPEAHKFVEFIHSDIGLKIWANLGFLSP